MTTEQKQNHVEIDLADVAGTVHRTLVGLLVLAPVALAALLFNEVARSNSGYVIGALAVCALLGALFTS